MDRHDIAHYTIAAALAGGLAFGGVQLHRIPQEPPSWRPATLTAEMLGHHDWTIYALPGSGALPDAIADVIRADGRKATVASAMNPYSGIWLAPATPEGKRIAAQLSAAFGVAVTVDDYPVGEKAYGTPYQIGVGTPK